MFTVECQDPNCMECKQAAKEQSSNEGNPSTMPKTVEESSKEGNQSKIPETAGQSSEEEVKKKLILTIEEDVAGDLFRANHARFRCLANCNNLKAKISYEIDELVHTLKQRKRDLLSTIEGDYCGLVQEIDNDCTKDSIDKILNRFDETKPLHSYPTLVYNSDFDALKRSVASFGKLTRPNIREPLKRSKQVSVKQIKEIQQIFETGNFFACKDNSAAVSSIEADAKTTSRAKNVESVSSTPVFDDAAFAELQIETEKTLQEMNHVSEKVSCELKEIGGVIDSRIKLHGRPSLEPELKTLDEITGLLKEMSLLKEHNSREKTLDEITREFKEIFLLKENKAREDEANFKQLASKVGEEGSKIIIEDKISEDPQTKTFKEVNRVNEKVSRDLKEIGGLIDSRIKLHGRPPLALEIGSLDEITRELKEDLRVLKERRSSYDEAFFNRLASKVGEEGSKIIVEDKVSEDPQTMSAEERRRRREMHVLKVCQQREKEMKLGKMRRDNLISLARVNALNRKTKKDVLPAWFESLREDYSSKKDVQHTPLKLTRKDDPETLSGQIEKKMGAIAKNIGFAKTMEGQKKVEARKRRSLEVLDLEPDQEAKKNDSLGKDKQSKSNPESEDFRKRLTMMLISRPESENFESIDSMPNKETENNNSLEKDIFEELQADLKIISNQNRKALSQSSETTDSSSSEEAEKDCPLDYFEKLQADVKFIRSQKRETPSESFESTDSSSSEEAEKDSSLDEDDIEIISRLETESIPSDLSLSPPLPPKRRFKFGERPCFAYLLRKKAVKEPALSGTAVTCGSESQKISLSSAAPSGGNTEVKEDQAFQESSSACLDSSKDVGPGSNPTLALRSSLAKYLEKNPESEWLAAGESSEQSKSAENSTKGRVVPNFPKELCQWLPPGFNRRKELSASAMWRPTADCDWLFKARK